MTSTERSKMSNQLGVFELPSVLLQSLSAKRGTDMAKLVCAWSCCRFVEFVHEHLKAQYIHQNRELCVHDAPLSGAR